MSDLFPTSGQAGVQTQPYDQSGGNLFGENNPAQLAAQQAMIQRMQAIQQAQLTPAQNGAFMASQAGSNLGNGIGNLINPPQPDPHQVKLAQIKQATDQEAQSSGITNPEDYLRLAASKLIQAGEYDYAIRAKERADSLAKGGADVNKTVSETNKNNSETNKNNQATAEAAVKSPFAVEMERLKSLGADPASLEKIAQANELAAKTGQVAPLAKARIELEMAQAKQANAISEKEAKQSDYQLMDSLFQEKGSGSITPAREALLNAMIDIKSKPQTIVNSVIGGAKTADTYMPAKAAPTAPIPTAPKAASMSGKPTGTTTDGRPFYKWSNGKNYFSPEPKK